MFFLLALLYAPREAKAQAYCDTACGSVILLALAGTTASVSADVYYTVRAYAGKETPQSGRNAIYWTSWQAGLLDTVAVVGLAQGPIQEDEVGMFLFTSGTWPLSLTANGMWHAYPNSKSTRGWALGMVAFSDITLIGYDAVFLGHKKRISPALALAETFVGTQQLGFGVITAARADPQDRDVAWTLSALPAILTTHGVLSLVLPESKDNVSVRARPSGSLASLPRLVATPVQGGLMMQAMGAF